MTKFTKMLLLLAAVTVGLLPSSCVIITNESEGSAMVRFTWEEAYQRNNYIQEIIAGYEDVKYWKTYVYGAYGYVEDDATDDPLYDGSYDIRDKIYSIRSPQYATRYKGVYQSISSGKYTAVCTVEDYNLDNTFDIVANYTIAGGAAGAVKYYEIAFDVRAAVDGREDLSWNKYDYENSGPDTPPRLEKTPAKRLVKKIVSDDVTFYVFSRPRNVVSEP